MNIRDLQYLTAVADAKHFGKASQQCFVSQPTLSMQLRKLEEELGVQIFERNNKQVIVTEIGKLLLEQARQILLEVNKLKNMATALQDPLGGHFNLGIIPTLGPYLLPKILPLLHEALPNLTILLHENKTEQIIDALKKGQLDAIILALPIETAGFESVFLFEEPFFVALANTHPLSRKKVLSVEDLSTEELLLLEEGHCLREQALSVCHFATTKPNFNATSLETVRHVVAAGSGITLLPKLAVDRVEKPSSLEIRPFKKPVPSRTIAMCWRKQSARQTCCLEIAKIIQKNIWK